MSATRAFWYSAPLLAAACLAVTHPALAQSARSGGSANALLMQQMQQLASERTALQAENAKMKKELADLAKERDTLKSGRAALDQRARVSEAANARSAQEKANADSENQKLKDRMQELVAKFRETAQTLKDVETERSAFKQSLAMRDAELSQCNGKNDALYKMNGEILTRMDGQGALSRLASLEPFTKLKRVELQNLVDEYKYRAEDQRVIPGAAIVPVSPPTSRADSR
jgi:chromosome segregation ATPase